MTALAARAEKEFSEAISNNLYYLHRDHLGSINLITDNSGDIVEKRQFDAWGNVVKLEDGAGNPLTNFVVLDRGYTGHEHLLGVGLINMNARLYDPLLHRFLSPDNYVQDPTNSQNFNRYGYGMNNPLSYTDESGEFWNLILGAGISVVTNGFGNLAHGQSFFHGVGRAALIGAFGGAFSTGIGNAAGEIGKGFGRTAFQTVAHGFLGGAMSVANDESFGSGFLAGSFGSLAAAGTEGLLGGISNQGIQGAGMVAAGTISGGIGAKIGGGNFWDGARDGAISAGLNHVAHMLMGDGEPWDKNGDGKLSKSEADDWFMHGGGKAISVNNGKINWSGLEMPDNVRIGQIFGVETISAFVDLPYETAATYGGTSFRRTGEHTVKVLDQAYHYNMRTKVTFSNYMRNYITVVGAPFFFSRGKQYMIHYKNPTIKIQ